MRLEPERSSWQRRGEGDAGSSFCWMLCSHMHFVRNEEKPTLEKKEFLPRGYHTHAYEARAVFVTEQRASLLGHGSHLLVAGTCTVEVRMSKHHVAEPQQAPLPKACAVIYGSVRPNIEEGQRLSVPP